MEYQPRTRAASSLNLLFPIAERYKKSLPMAFRALLLQKEHFLRLVDEAPELNEAITEWIDQLLKAQTL